MAATRQEFSTLDPFLEAIAAAGIRAVALRAVREVRPRKLKAHGIEVGHQQWVELAAYQKGALYVAQLDGAESEPIEKLLKAHGLTVKSGSGNIT
jgi:hypothetical protein